MNKTKLKDLKYQINGVDSDKPLKQCIQAIAIGILFPLVLAIIFRIANLIITGS